MMMRGGRRREDRLRPIRRLHPQQQRWYQHSNWRPQWLGNWNPHQYWQGPPHHEFSWRPPYPLPQQYYLGPPAPWHQQHRSHHWREERSWQYPQEEIDRYEPHVRTDTFVESRSHEDFSVTEECCGQRSHFRCIPLVQGALHEHPRHVDNYDYPHLSVNEDDQVQDFEFRTSKIEDSRGTEILEQESFNSTQKSMYDRIDKITPFVSNREVPPNFARKHNSQKELEFPAQKSNSRNIRDEVPIMKENKNVKHFNAVPPVPALESTNDIPVSENGQKEQIFINQNSQMFNHSEMEQCEETEMMTTCTIPGPQKFSAEDNFAYVQSEGSSDRMCPVYQIEDSENDQTETSQDVYPVQGQAYQLIPLMMVIHPPPFYYYTNPFANRCQMLDCALQPSINCQCQNADMADDNYKQNHYENGEDFIDVSLEIAENTTASTMVSQKNEDGSSDFPKNTSSKTENKNFQGHANISESGQRNCTQEQINSEIMDENNNNLEMEPSVNDSSRVHAVQENKMITVHERSSILIPALKVDKTTQTLISSMGAYFTTEQQIEFPNDTQQSYVTKSKQQRKNKRSVANKLNSSDKSADVCNNSSTQLVLDTSSEVSNLSHQCPSNKSIELEQKLDKRSSRNRTSAASSPVDQKFSSGSSSPKNSSPGQLLVNTGHVNLGANAVCTQVFPRRNQSWKAQAHHEVFTSIKGTKCPLGRLYLSDCEWVGSIEERCSHLAKFHHEEFENKSSVKVLRNGYKVLKAFNEIFICYNSVHPTNNKLYCVVHHACVKHDCISKFQYTCELSSEDSLQKIEETRTVAPIFEPLKNLMRTGRCVKVDGKVLRSFIGKTFYIVFKIKPPKDF